MSSVCTATGLVLRTRNYQDQDKWVDILTPDQGRISCLVKGVRKITSKRQSALQPASRVKFSFLSKGETNLLTEAILIKNYWPRLQNLDLMRDLNLILEVVYHTSLEGIEQADFLQRTEIILAYMQNQQADYHRGLVRQQLFDLLAQQGIELPEYSDQHSVLELVESVLGRPLRSWKFLTL